MIRKVVGLEYEQLAATDNHSGLSFNRLVGEFAEFAFGFTDGAGFNNGPNLDS